MRRRGRRGKKGVVVGRRCVPRPRSARVSSASVGPVRQPLRSRGCAASLGGPTPAFSDEVGYADLRQIVSARGRRDRHPLRDLRRQEHRGPPRLDPRAAARMPRGDRRRSAAGGSSPTTKTRSSPPTVATAAPGSPTRPSTPRTSRPSTGSPSSGPSTQTASPAATAGPPATPSRSRCGP